MYCTIWISIHKQEYKIWLRKKQRYYNHSVHNWSIMSTVIYHILKDFSIRRSCYFSRNLTACAEFYFLLRLRKNKLIIYSGNIEFNSKNKDKLANICSIHSFCHHYFFKILSALINEYLWLYKFDDDEVPSKVD